jgi:hypothetical protein
VRARTRDIADRWGSSVSRRGGARGLAGLSWPEWAAFGFSFSLEFLMPFIFYFIYGFQIKFKHVHQFKE